MVAIFLLKQNYLLSKGVILHEKKYVVEGYIILPYGKMLQFDIYNVQHCSEKQIMNFIFYIKSGIFGPKVVCKNSKLDWNYLLSLFEWMWYGWTIWKLFSLDRVYIQPVCTFWIVTALTFRSVKSYIGFQLIVTRIRISNEKIAVFDNILISMT